MDRNQRDKLHRFRECRSAQLDASRRRDLLKLIFCDRVRVKLSMLNRSSRNLIAQSKKGGPETVPQFLRMARPPVALARDALPSSSPVSGIRFSSSEPSLSQPLSETPLLLVPVDSRQRKHSTPPTLTVSLSRASIAQGLLTLSPTTLDFGNVGGLVFSSSSGMYSRPPDRTGL
jgi:hypothetical protein